MFGVGLVVLWRHAKRTKRRVRLFRDDNLDSAFLPQDVDADIFRMTFKREVNGRVSNLEILHLNVLQERRQDRLGESEACMRGINAQTETRLEQEKHRNRGPRLRTTGDRVQRRTFTGPAREPAEQLGQSMQLKKLAGVEEPANNLQCALFEPLGGHPRCDQGIVVRPDRSIVIGHRIVSDLRGCDGPDAPSVKKLLAH